MFEPPVHPGERGERSGRHRGLDTHRSRDRHRRRGVQQVVGTVDAERERMTFALDDQGRPGATGTDRRDLHSEVRVRIDAVREDRAARSRDRPHRRKIVGAHDQQVASLGEGGERVFDLREAAAVEIEVVDLDVGHDAHRGPAEQEGAVALVCLGDEQLARSRVRPTAGLVGVSSDHERRIHAGALQDQRDHRGGRGLAVGTGDGDLSATRRRGRERLRPSPGRDPATARLDQLGVVVTDRGGDDDRVRVAEVAHVVTHGDRGAEGPELLHTLRVLQIRAGDAHSPRQEQPREVPHAGASDPDHVHPAEPGDVGHLQRGDRSRRRNVGAHDPPPPRPRCARGSSRRRASPMPELDPPSNAVDRRRPATMRSGR